MWLLVSLWLANAPVLSVVVPKDAPEALVRVACPLNQTTRIVFPEALRQLKGPGQVIGLKVEQTRPEGVIVVRPTTHPSSTTVEFRGPSTTFRLLLESASEGEAGEVHLRFEEAAPPPQPEPGAVSGAAPGSLAAVPSPAPVETPRPAEVDPPAPHAAPAIFDLEGVLRAKPVSIGRREGLPGQRPMLLVDALQGDAWVWFRFALEGGGDAHIARISWEQGDIATFVQEPSGKDLRVIVQLPRAGVTRRAHLALEVESGPTYTFALSSRSLGGFLKELFR